MRGTPKLFTSVQDIQNCLNSSDLDVAADSAKWLYAASAGDLTRLGISTATKRSMLLPVATSLNAFGINSGWLVVMEGDSLTGSFTLPSQVAGKLEVPVVNVGAGGDTVAAIVGEAATQVDPLFDDDLYFRQITIIEGGINDLGGGATQEQLDALVANFWTWCDARKVIGWEVGVCTITPRTGTSQEANRLWVNTQLRADWEYHADFLIDAGADATIGNHDLVDDLTWWRDGVHPTWAGFEIFAQVVATSVISI